MALGKPSLDAVNDFLHLIKVGGTQYIDFIGALHRSTNLATSRKNRPKVVSVLSNVVSKMSVFRFMSLESVQNVA